MNKLLILAVALIPSLLFGMALPDKVLEGAKVCTQYMKKYEDKYHLPFYILPSISITETGRYHRNMKMKLPWPWTINAEGTSYFLDTKEEAVKKVATLQKEGMKLIDVGCMQVNLYHHGKAFKSLEEAFDPEINIAYAAKFLKNNHKKTGSWETALKYYHSKTEKYGNAYLKRVYNTWNFIQRKIVDTHLNSKNYRKYTAIFGERTFKRKYDGDVIIYQAVTNRKTGVVINRAVGKETQYNMPPMPKKNNKEANNVGAVPKSIKIR